MNWWERGEWSDTRGDYQAPPDFNNSAGADLLGDAGATAEMLSTPLGEPPSDFDVRSVYDSRPINAYDFNFSGTAEEVDTFPWTIAFTVPNGYRAVPREWHVFFDNPPTGPASASTVTLQQNGSGLPNNGPIIIGMGTGSDPIKSFFVCEENTTFGISGNVDTANSGHASLMSVNVYGNLIPVSEVALPFSIANKLLNKLLED